ncbi:MAG: cupin domain-containing protein [Candidatus Cloacimonadota bacterium]
MISRSISEIAPVLNKNGMTGTKIYSAPEGEIVHIAFEPGAHLPAHKTPVNVAFFVVEGIATIQIGEETQEFPVNTTIESPKEIPHAITNNGSGLLRILVIKMPKP